MLSVQTELENYPANPEEFLWNPVLTLNISFIWFFLFFFFVLAI